MHKWVCQSEPRPSQPDENDVSIGKLGVESWRGGERERQRERQTDRQTDRDRDEEKGDG